ncbi:P-loop ATPase, Sll1717 family [Verminephrobacter aporrectodeae]|uniref:P-loop ATPase, Sll1717 family n=1 Tax=Verminephrobacter aporrectodeae TaxID=1110389 RepID=UPI00223840A8|nr:hypothetical protein [Verminephrobacter aporrectodeae]MCW8175643.1 hypothetical protein [Verminephrobacter aporrectodeae subsp. tuberculatae]MCW8203228.1 hypothetical protein [Verminephrobacter aporrectodeae subsp. tuberculatae]
MAVETHTLSVQQRTALREELRKALQTIPTDGSTDDWSDVYVPLSHQQALNPERMLVEGMRGAGKSFWTGVLANSDLLNKLGRHRIGTDLQDALRGIKESHAIKLDAPAAKANFPSPVELPLLRALPGVTPETIWSVAILLLFVPDPALGMPRSTDAHDPWQAPMAWAGQHPGRIARALDLLDERLTSSKETALVVFDALDRASNELTQVSEMTAGLLRVMLQLRFAKGLRLKAFIREDILAQAGPVVDGSKLLNSKVTLQWTQADLYGLAFYRIAQRSDKFRAFFSRVAGISWRSDGGRYECNDSADEPDKQEKLWRALVGDYMGKTATKGHSYRYIYNHLSDGLGRVAPRTFLTALRAALESASTQYSDKPHVIHHEAIRDGVRDASTARVTELHEEYQWIAPALQCIKDQKKTIPIDKEELEKIWLQNKASVLQKIESMRDKALVPWQNGAPNSERMERLLATLEQIGIVRPRKKNGNERIELPDIYRLAYKIGRHGGISTQRKPKS